MRGGACVRIYPETGTLVGCRSIVGGLHDFRRGARLAGVIKQDGDLVVAALRTPARLPSEGKPLPEDGCVGAGAVGLVELLVV